MMPAIYELLLFWDQESWVCTTICSEVTDYCVYSGCNYTQFVLFKIQSEKIAMTLLILDASLFGLTGGAFGIWKSGCTHVNVLQIQSWPGCNCEPCGGFERKPCLLREMVVSVANNSADDSLIQ